jgi:hypothetical protein
MVGWTLAEHPVPMAFQAPATAAFNRFTSA